MPTYEFRCPEGHEFEKFFRSISSAESIAACPQCGVAAERMMSATGFAFKGSGFYLTDYGKNAHRGEAPPSGKGDSDGGSASTSDSSKSDASGSSESGKAASSGTEGGAKSDSGGSESKPAPKAEPKATESKPAPAAPKPSSSE